jgi:hypothetical protein
MEPTLYMPKPGFPGPLLIHESFLNPKIKNPLTLSNQWVVKIPFKLPWSEEAQQPALAVPPEIAVDCWTKVHILTCISEIK